jgi:choline dehydrogenase-like flavoprotein
VISPRSRHAIVVGAGPAGVVVAHDLAAAGWSVRVFEAGTGTDRPPRNLFAALPGNLIDTSLARRTAAQAVKPYLLGTGVGGGSRVNGLLFDGPVDPQWPSTSVGPENWTPTERLIAAAATADGMDVQPSRLLGDAHGRWHSLPMLNDVELLTGCTVQSIATAATRPVVHAMWKGTPLVVDADAVVVTAGALATPRLLAASGCESALLGKQLADHPSIAFRFGAGDGQRLVPRDRFGPALNAHFRSEGRACLLTLFDAGDESLVLVTLLESRSRGSLVPTHAELNLLDEPGDVHAMRTAVRRVAAMLHHSACRHVSGPDGRATGDIGDATDDDLNHWIARNEDGTYHATGTAARGASPGSVADLDGRVRGFRNVWVADGSAVGSAPLGAPMATIMYLARTVARTIAAEGATQIG